MTPQALTNLKDRLTDIDQLLKAHTAILKFNKAESAAKQAGGDLAQIVKVLTALTSSPGPGKPQQVDAINRSAFVLLCAHFQGFIDEYHAELGRKLLKGKAKVPEAVIKLVKPPRSNPHPHIIDQMFAGIGIYDLMSSLSWNKCSAAQVKSRLTGYLETRNKIAHGGRERITKQRVEGLKKYVETFATNLVKSSSKKAEAQLGPNIWAEV